VYDTGKGMPVEYIILFKDQLEELAGSGSSVLYITTEEGLPKPRSIYDQPVLLIKSPDWKNKVKYLKQQGNAGFTGTGNCKIDG
jgi:hypothetical protein